MADVLVTTGEVLSGTWISAEPLLGAADGGCSARVKPCWFGAAETSFTLPSGATDLSCSFDVLVQDNRGGSGHGQVTVPVGAPANLSAPIITFSVQPFAPVNPGAAVTLTIEAIDPQASTLAFVWHASGGLLSGQADTDGSSQVTWTAPPTGSGSFTVSAVVTDALGLVTEHDFTIETAAP